MRHAAVTATAVIPTTTIVDRAAAVIGRRGFVVAAVAITIVIIPLS
jgi:hypothetical protein